MSGHDITTAFMIATGVMIAICALASLLKREALELFAMAGLVTVFTFVSRIVSLNSDMPWSASPWPVQDALCVLLLLYLWHSQQDWWKAALAVCFGFQCGAHVVYWWLVFVSGGTTQGLTVAYLWAINPVFGVELFILTLAGGRHVGGYVLDRARLLLVRDPRASPVSAR